MDGLSRSVGDGISGLIGNAIAGIGAAWDGALASLGAVVPPGAMPVLGVAAALVVGWLVLRR